MTTRMMMVLQFDLGFFFSFQFLEYPTGLVIVVIKLEELNGESEC